MVTASHAPARTYEESEGASHVSESTMVAASTGKGEDADIAFFFFFFFFLGYRGIEIASDSFDFVVASPSP